MTMGIKILLADDHTLMRDGLRALIEKAADMQVVAEAGDGRTTVQLTKELLPDVVVMDVSMPELNGIEAAREIVATCPRVKVLALSMHSDRRFVVEMLRAGALGYLLKDCACQELISAIRAVVAKTRYLSPRIADVIVKDYVHLLPKMEPSVFCVLTARERQVLQLLAEGKTVKEMSFCLQVSVKTVETYRQRTMDKLNTRSIAELIKYAIREGLTPLET